MSKVEYLQPGIIYLDACSTCGVVTIINKCLYFYCSFLGPDGHRRRGSHNWSAGARHPVTHDPSGRKATSV